jgi:hypothetical protein
MNQTSPAYRSMLNCVATYETFETWADVYSFLESHRLCLEDAERTIQRACSLTPDGATRDEVVRYFRMAHGVPPDEAPWVEFLAAFFHHRRRIRRARGRYNAPPPEQRVLALVSVPPDEFGLVEPFVHRGSAIFVDGDV